MLKAAMATVATLILGCSLTVSPDQGSHSPADASENGLADAWVLRIRVDKPRVGGAMPPLREYAGAVALLPIAPERAQPWMAVSGFRYAGVFTDSFQAVGLEAAEGERIPLAAGKMLGADSVEVLLNPTRDHGAMVLTGVMNGKKVTGVWEVTGYVPGARGTFEMTPLD